MILPEELYQFRTESGLTQTQLAEMLNDILGMRYNAATVSNWEGQKKNIPEYVQDALAELITVSNGGAQPSPSGEFIEPPPEPEEARKRGRPRSQPADSAPNVPRGAPVILPAVGDVIATGLESATTEMFLGIGQMVELMGAMFSPQKVVFTGPDKPKISLIEADGRIIASDAEALGKAWAKLAGQNAWVARVINSLTVGGAWVDVLAATSGTLVKVYQNHAGYAQWLSEQAGQNGSVSESTDDITVPPTE